MNHAKWNEAEGKMLLVAAKMVGLLSVAAADDKAPRYIATRAAEVIAEYNKYAAERLDALKPEPINEQ